MKSGLNMRHSKNSSERSIESIYCATFMRLKRFAKEYVIDEGDAENIVQDAFALLLKCQELDFSPKNPQAWLFATVKNRCLNFLRHASIMKESENSIVREYHMVMEANLEALEELRDDIFENANLEQLLQDAIDSLPPRCREIFLKCRIEGKSQQETADALGVSVNTVETQIGIAYKKLKQFFDKIK